MSSKIVFVLMSAVHRADAIDQLLESLAPHTVLVHHDFSQTPDFRLNAPNAVFVPDARRTGWAVWGFTDGIFHSMRHALAHHPFDYLQLLSPTCMPIKPIAAFEHHVRHSPHDAHFGAVDLLQDHNAMMTLGYRAFAREHTNRHRVLRRVMMDYFRSGDFRYDIGGIQLRHRAPEAEHRFTMRDRLYEWITHQAATGFLSQHPFHGDFRPCIGSTWFGACRHVVEWMIQRFDKPDVQDYFKDVRIADEFLLPSLLAMSGASRGPMNTLVNNFSDANPLWFEVKDLERLRESKAYFARKFIDDPQAPVRQLVLNELVRQPFTPTSSEPVPRSAEGREGSSILQAGEPGESRATDTAQSARNGARNYPQMESGQQGKGPQVTGAS